MPGPGSEDDVDASDEGIVMRMRDGDEAGLEALLRQHGPHVKSLLGIRFRLPHGDHALEDAVHDAALIMFRRARRLDPGNNIRGFFYRTASRELARSLRRTDAAPREWNGSPEEIPARPRQTDPSELSRALERLLLDLPDTERQVLTLDIASSFTLSARQIARELDTTPQTVYSLRNRTKSRLRGFLTAWDARRDGSPDDDGAGL